MMCLLLVVSYFSTSNVVTLTFFSFSTDLFKALPLLIGFLSFYMLLSVFLVFFTFSSFLSSFFSIDCTLSTALISPMLLFFLIEPFFPAACFNSS